MSKDLLERRLLQIGGVSFTAYSSYLGLQAGGPAGALVSFVIGVFFSVATMMLSIPRQFGPDALPTATALVVLSDVGALLGWLTRVEPVTAQPFYADHLYFLTTNLALLNFVLAIRHLQQRMR